MELNFRGTWKDVNSRESLTSDEHALHSESSIGTLELADEALTTINGAFGPLFQGNLLGIYTGYGCNYDNDWDGDGGYGDRRFDGWYGNRRSDGWYGNRRFGGWYGGGYPSCGF
ncbi:hypothetical protein KDH_36640 [Dictyobacter sp. S3.2.2.5]|uniref:Uncharacterized protein n=1 Tax=Dictyobacter halimunensis TaxID=3026934 RepID=A0ABQ6FSZ9_9CHLR|nr:hypothetical protein KDH_36640 [Dictyobacter sp. S3.2.2.5]